MSQEKQSEYWIAGVSGLLGSAAGALGGITFGPPGAILGAAVGGPIGIYLGKKVDPKEVISEILLEHLATERLLKRKLLLDIENSFLISQEKTDASLELTRSILETAGVLRDFSNDPRIPKREPHTLHPRELSAEETARFSSIIAGHTRQIKLNCPCIEPAAVATLKSLQGRLDPFGVRLLIDFSSINGREQISQVDKSERIDFLITAIEPFFYSHSTAVSEYRFIFPCNGETQCVFHKKHRGWGKASRVHVFRWSAAEVQFHLGVGIPALAEMGGLNDASNLGELIDEIEGGDLLVAWEPLASEFFNNRKIEVMPNSRYRVIISLFCHKRWRHPRLYDVREAIKRLFVNEWRIVARDPGMGLDLLRNDGAYMALFAYAGGLSAVRPLVSDFSD